jgi:hypothetical protein
MLVEEASGPSAGLAARYRWGVVGAAPLTCVCRSAPHVKGNHAAALCSKACVCEVFCCLLQHSADSRHSRLSRVAHNSRYRLPPFLFMIFFK